MSRISCSPSGFPVWSIPLVRPIWPNRMAKAWTERKILVANHGAAGEVMALSWPSGKVLWRAPNQHGHDVQGLPNGHVLYTVGPAHKVIELDAERRPVWEYGEAEGLQHPLAAERL